MKTAVITFGRFNPPTTGHELLFDKVYKIARKNGADFMIFASHSQNADKDPLPYKLKIKYLKKMFPRYRRNIIETNARQIFEVAVSIFKMKYNNLIMVVGSDRVAEFDRILTKYNNVKGAHGFYNFENVKVVSAGSRDPDADNVSGMSASKMRKFVKDGDVDSFVKGLPKQFKDPDGLWNDLKKHMGIKEMKESVSVELNESMSFDIPEFGTGKLVGRNIQFQAASGKKYTLSIKDMQKLDMNTPNSAGQVKSVTRKINTNTKVKGFRRLSATGKFSLSRKFDTATKTPGYSYSDSTSFTHIYTNGKDHIIIPKEVIERIQKATRKEYLSWYYQELQGINNELGQRHGHIPAGAVGTSSGYAQFTGGKVKFKNENARLTLSVADIQKIEQGKKVKRFFRDKSDVNDIPGKIHVYTVGKSDYDVKHHMPAEIMKKIGIKESIDEQILQETKEAVGKKAEESGISYSILKQVYDRGMAAWKDSHRPGTTPQQWALARVNSFIKGGKTRTTADADLWDKSKKESFEIGTDEYAKHAHDTTPGQKFKKFREFKKEFKEMFDVSEGTAYHLKHQTPFHENIFRPYSTQFYEVFNEARELYEAGLLENVDSFDRYLLETDIGMFAIYEGKEVPLDIPMIAEEEDVELNSPKKGGPKKYYVHVKDPSTGNIKKVTWGDTTGLQVKLDDPEARKAFAARHKCDQQKDKTTPAYWACNLPRYADQLGLKGGGNFFW